MNDKFIKKLAIASYTKETLDQSKINRIVKHLSKSELKNYIRNLKNLERQKTVYVYVSKVTSQIQDEFAKMFKDKKVIVKEDRSLIAGVKVVNNDIIFEQNIKNNMDNLIGFISQ